MDIINEVVINLLNAPYTEEIGAQIIQIVRDVEVVEERVQLARRIQDNGLNYFRYKQYLDFMDELAKLFENIQTRIERIDFLNGMLPLIEYCYRSYSVLKKNYKPVHKAMLRFNQLPVEEKIHQINRLDAEYTLTMFFIGVRHRNVALVKFMAQNRFRLVTFRQVSTNMLRHGLDVLEQEINMIFELEEVD